MVEITTNNLVQHTIRSQFVEYCEKNGYEPKFANCQIQWLDDKSTCDVTIKMSSDAIESEDDHILFYCDSLKDLESLTEPGCEDFIVTEIYSFEDELL